MSHTINAAVDLRSKGGMKQRIVAYVRYKIAFRWQWKTFVVLG